MDKRNFPVGGVATLKKIDDFLEGLGLVKYRYGLGNTISIPYQRATAELLSILRFEAAASMQQRASRKSP